MTDEGSRRAVSTRNANFAKKTAQALAAGHISPNQISLASIFFAGLSLGAYWMAENNSWYLVLAVVFIQGRLLCNLFDGMVAIEYNKKSKVGDLYNEVPDRISDTLILFGVGYYCRHFSYAMDLAWAAIFLSTMTAYIRVFGSSLIKKHYFIGPMAKQHRMFTVSVASLLAIVWPAALYYSLFVMIVGLIVTNGRRLKAIAVDLNK